MSSNAGTPAPEILDAGFSVSHQKVDLELDLLSRSLTGKTEITLNPLSAESRIIRLNLRQCRVDSVLINGRKCQWLNYQDPYQQAKLPYKAKIHQYHLLQARLDQPRKDPQGSELLIGLPLSVKFEAIGSDLEETQSILLAKSLGGSKRGSDLSTVELAQGPNISIDSAARFAPITLEIGFAIDRIRDGMHFVGLEDGDMRYPHAYTTNAAGSQGSRCLFPCVDSITARCTFEISIKTPRTLGDLFHCSHTSTRPSVMQQNGTRTSDSKSSSKDFQSSFSAEDRAIELSVLCSGEVTDEVTDPKNASKKTTSFICSKEISAKHVGFAVGAFEEVDLSAFRDSDEDDRLGQSAIPVHAFCTPGRAEDVKNTCFPIVQAIDYNVIPFGSFPYTHYNLCFVDDCPSDVIHASTLSICDSGLLFPFNVLDPIDSVTRTLVHALATQWFGIDIVPKGPEDLWVIYGLAYFMTEAYLKTLFGKNEYRYRQKIAVDKVVDLDVERPSLTDLGVAMDLDPSQEEFMALKAPLVLFILDQRILKTGNAAGVSRIINRLLLNAKTGEMQNNLLDTSSFIKVCDRLSHLKLDQFFNQWVFGSGCPRFSATQRFNKKKLVVEMTIKQTQGNGPSDKTLNPNTFMRDVREDAQAVYAGPLQTCFTGPMTIRIHEADGTPYEHIVQINQAIQHIEVPYNTKYKRIKRNRKEKERPAKDDDGEYEGDEAGETLLYSLGDVLQSDEDISAWQFKDWDKDDEAKMGNESYEWIRMDVDFEWICKIRLAMPGYMWISQLQQDRDVVAQYESIQFLGTQESGNALVSTFLTRTLMDTRYFHGVRSAAAAILSSATSEKHDYIALFHLEKAFKEFYCYPDTDKVRPNDFSDRAAYLIQCAIVKAFGNARDDQNRSPFRARRWILDKLKYNDNSRNQFSDGYYIALLMDALASAISSKRPFSEVDDLEDPGEDNILFHQSCLNELERYRRADDWTASHSNIVSRTALNCRAKLVAARFLKFNPLDFLQYTSVFAAPLLRTEALAHLLTISQVKDARLLKYYLFALGTDPSPFVREALLRHLFLVLSRIAIGVDSPSTRAPTEPKTDTLVVETEASTEAHKADFGRKHSLEGALEALKQELADNKTLQDGLWTAITSPVTSLKHIERLLEICEKMYTPETSGVVILHLPRYWSCHKVGKAKLRFVQDGKVRTRPLPRREAKPLLKLKMSSAPNGAGFGGSRSGPSTPDIGIVRRDSGTGPPRPFIKPPKPPPSQQPTIERKASTTSLGSVGSDDSEGQPFKRKLTLKFGKASGGS